MIAGNDTSESVKLVSTTLVKTVQQKEGIEDQSRKNQVSVKGVPLFGKITNPKWSEMAPYGICHDWLML